MTDKIVILLKESAVESWKRDAGSVLAAFAMILPGWFIGSTGLQVIGAIMLMLIIMFRASGVRKASEMTVDEALARLQALAGEG